ncbi:MAG TPA: 16S rRNA (cytosine(967)-C(5))-methyltransferase [Oscillatoriaceae cyanobacterium M7585_C2015_266]|nr:16S rRNA (cytosine(967)-C(5))-methyltransferase [Oscillatoriaceae cyanobacterium M7585_C2015_266]
MNNPRQIAFLALRDVHRGAFADIALTRWLRQAKLSDADRRLTTELVYGCIRRMRTLDALIDLFAKKKSRQQPPDLRTILHLGLYQLRYLSNIPAAAAVDTTVELCKKNSLVGLAGFVNALLRQYICNTDTPLQLPENPAERLGILHSFPDWIVQFWIEQLGFEEAEQLCQWFNKSPTIDLRVNPLRTSIEQVEAALEAAGATVTRVPHLPQALRLKGGTGAIENLPGYKQGWWSVQDSSAQLVGYLLEPQPGEVVFDVCAAPGGKTTHLAELMRDEGKIIACDKAESRLRKLAENAQRLQHKSIEIFRGDVCNISQFENVGDRVLLDAPCSGLGTLHRRADARWRHTPENVQKLAELQGKLLQQVAGWLKEGGVLVYATCTLHPLENENLICAFLERHSNWEISPPAPESPVAPFATPEGWIKVWPHRHQMDGFFMVRLIKGKNKV